MKYLLLLAVLFLAACTGPTEIVEPMPQCLPDAMQLRCLPVEEPTHVRTVCQ